MEINEDLTIESILEGNMRFLEKIVNKNWKLMDLIYIYIYLKELKD